MSATPVNVLSGPVNKGEGARVVHIDEETTTITIVRPESPPRPEEPE